MKNEETTLESAKEMLRGTYFDTNPGDLDKFAQAFCTASLENNVNLSFLIAKCITEAGAAIKGGASKLCTGIENKGKIVYNMYGIGANDGNAVFEGAQKAYNEGWFSQEEAIIGGAKWIYESYVKIGQDTLYAQRYNYIDYEKQNKIINQYASAIDMAYTKGKRMYDKMSKRLNTLNASFKIPVYDIKR